MPIQKMQISNILNNIKKYKNVAEDFFYMYFVVIIQRVLGFVVTYFLVRSLSQTQFAEYSLIIGYLSLFAPFSLPGISNALMQSTVRGYNSFYPKALKVTFLGTVLAGLLMLVFAFMHSSDEGYTDTFKVGLLFAALCYPLYRGLTLWQARLSGVKKFKLMSALDASSSIVTYLMILFLLIGYDVTDYILLIVVYMLIPSLFNIVLSLFDFYKYTQEEKMIDQENMQSYGMNVSFYSAIHTVALRLDEFILFYFISPQVMAVYTIANKIPEMLRSVTQTLAAILAPRFAKHPKLTVSINKAIKLYSLGFGAAIIAVTFTIYPYAMNFLFSDKYAEATLYSQIIMCSLVIGNMANLNFRFIRSQQDSKSFKNVTLIISFTKVLTAIILIPIVGIWGAIASLFLYRIAMLLSVEYIIRKKYT